MFAPYFAADEAQTLDAIYGNDQNAIAGVFPFTLIMIHADDILHLSRQGRIRKDGERAHNAHVRRYPLPFSL